MTFKDKPLLFSAALFLSLLGGTVAIAFYLFAVIFYSTSIEAIKNITNTISTDGTSRFYFLCLLMLYTFSVLGVVKMIKWRKSGFWIYGMSQTIILLFPLLWLGRNSFSATNSIFTALFILIYTSFYKKMK